ncbi:polysaccharide deacetylase family protein, partial [Candidatus Woesearchaeota archaeon]|nr:polysaccharide deacetylase family protein [Candidatus Woesearchaeota archaeon]
MVDVCFYFQVHQPARLKNYSVFEIGKNHDYFDHKKNRDVLEKVSNKCYIPANNLMLQLIKNHPEFRISYSLSGILLDQLEEYAPEVLQSFQSLADTGNVEILEETYYHSLAFMYSKSEFKKQIALHKKKIKKLFNYTPKIFRNTELIYNNELANYIEKMGYKGILAEGADHVLGWRSPNFVYSPKTTSKIKLLLKNYKLSDDIAFRFSNQGWPEWPLTTGKFTQWVNNINGGGNTVNLFMDYETFGEHQWSSTGIFNFMKNLPKEILKHPDNSFATPSEIVKKFEPLGELDVHHVVSWADMERDLSAWLGNKMQQSAVQKIYALEKTVKRSKDEKLVEDWRKLQTSDHFYYMCTKWFNDGDVHKYFNPYDSPYDAFITYMNIL